MIFDEWRRKTSVDVKTSRGSIMTDAANNLDSIRSDVDMVAIERTQYGPGLKLKGKFLGPYQVTKRNENDRYEMKKIGNDEGPRETSSAADKMKPWGR